MRDDPAEAATTTIMVLFLLLAGLTGCAEYPRVARLASAGFRQSLRNDAFRRAHGEPVGSP